MNAFGIHTSTVLVVDDDSALRDVFRNALRFAGFETLTAADGVAALRQIDNQAVDVVVLDLDLPGLNGMAIHEELTARVDTRDLPVVIVTGTEWDSPYPAVATLRKPITPDELVAVVRKASRRAVRT